MDGAAQLAAQLPHLVRGVFYDGFDPGPQPERIRDRETFLILFGERAQLSGGEAERTAATAMSRSVARTACNIARHCGFQSSSCCAR
jgi:uncharacterized protein (DUF2267 family)